MCDDVGEGPRRTTRNQGDDRFRGGACLQNEANLLNNSKAVRGCGRGWRNPLPSQLVNCGEWAQMWSGLMVRVSMVAALMLMTLTADSVAQSVAIELNPAQQAQIKEYVLKQRIPVAEVKQTIAIGSAVPTEVELRPVPPGGVRPYRSSVFSTGTNGSTLSTRQPAGLSGSWNRSVVSTQERSPVA